MRILSILLAIVVAVALYLWVIERDATLAFIAENFSPEASTEETAQDAALPQDTPEDDNALIKVVAVTSFARELDSAVILRGQTEAVREVTVRAETSSTVQSPPLRAGAFISENQLLCELSVGTRAGALNEARAQLAEAIAGKTEAESRIPEAQSRVIEAQARIDEALVNRTAARRLSQEGFAADTRVKSTEANVAGAEATLEAAKSSVTAATAGMQSADARIESAAAAVATAEKELERLEIRAPFAGVLETSTAELGALLQPGDVCATVIQLDPIKLVAFVPETEVSRISVGAMGRARLAAGGENISGKVTFLSRSSDPTTRTFRVEMEVPNTALDIRDGQTAQIDIDAPGSSAHLLPASALTLNADGQLGLRTLDENSVVQFVPVNMVRDTVEGVWLTGLPDRADVIVVGQEFVTAGVKVAPTYQERTQ
ncbi:MAG: efflux RND transporter periplasmic adaptor subunit [Tateyamaria sp.]|uniref:efflux RND transporter periplasmic adaptor subunit n=1 Tax=Tateyamaria sp. TaxID=1929288 RepID=UPI00329C1105